MEAKDKENMYEEIFTCQLGGLPMKYIGMLVSYLELNPKLEIPSFGLLFQKLKILFTNFAKKPWGWQQYQILGGLVGLTNQSK